MFFYWERWNRDHATRHGVSEHEASWVVARPTPPDPTPVGSGKQTTRSAGGITGDRCVWSAKKKGTGGLKGQPLKLEVVVESGSALAGSYEQEKTEDPLEADDVAGLGDEAFIKDLKLHALVGERVLSVALHNYRYPTPLTEQQIQQKEEDAAKLALGRLSPT